MRALLLLCCTALLPILAAEPPVPVRVALYVTFEQPPPDAVIHSLRSELDSIMAPAGLTFDWLSFPAAGFPETAPELAVVNVKGRCATAGPPPHGHIGALGWTHISDGVILPFTDLDCDGLHAFLGEQLISLRLRDRDGALGRALGRVLAHELYHIFANTTRHAREGVGKPVYSVKDLLAPDFHFSQIDTVALRSATH